MIEEMESLGIRVTCPKPSELCLSLAHDEGLSLRPWATHLGCLRWLCLHDCPHRSGDAAHSGHMGSEDSVSERPVWRLWMVPWAPAILHKCPCWSLPALSSTIREPCYLCGTHHLASLCGNFISWDFRYRVVLCFNHFLEGIVESAFAYDGVIRRAQSTCVPLRALQLIAEKRQSLIEGRRSRGSTN